MTVYELGLWAQMHNAVVTISPGPAPRITRVRLAVFGQPEGLKFERLIDVPDGPQAANRAVAAACNELSDLVQPKTSP